MISILKSLDILKKLPSEIVESAATTQHFASGMRLLNPFIVRTLDHGGFVAPVILAVAELECSCWCGDHRLVARIALASLEDQN